MPDEQHHNGPLIYAGIHNVYQAHFVPRAMISLNRLERRKADFNANEWILDSGAFTRIASGKGHMPTREYADQAERWSKCGSLEAAVAQDYMCEPFILDATGLSVTEHQKLSTRNYLELRERLLTVYAMPVIQGFTAQQYQDHTEALAPHLPENAWTGVGSLCKRQGSPDTISAIISAIKAVRPDLKLHGFGVKTTALRRADIWHRLHSVDSAAWSYSATRNGNPGDRNSIEFCLEWTNRIARNQPGPSQISML